MHHYSFSYSYDSAPPIFKRGRQAMLVLQDKEGNYILGAKNRYPQGISRFVGGGINPGEDPLAGAVRELDEELGVKKSINELKPLATINLNLVETNSGERFTYDLYLYHATITEDLNPADDLDGVISLTKNELEELIYRFEHLDTSLNEDNFRWSDYGRFFAEVHRIGLSLTEPQD